jgi:6,7-dimethyl-8-ribityllumazine synthase
MGRLMMEFKMKVRKDIVRFMFPCTQCNGYRFHVLCEQPSGLALIIPFTRRAIASTHKGYQVVCASCTVVNGRLERADVDKLASNTIPKSLWTDYPVLHDFYQPEFIEQSGQALFPEEPDGEGSKQAREWLSNYRLET